MTNRQISCVPNIIVVYCGYTNRLEPGTKHGDKLREVLDEFGDEYTILDQYKDFDMSSNFAIQFTECNVVPLSMALSLIGLMGYVNFCGCLCVENITSITVTDEYCLMEINTESG